MKRYVKDPQATLDYQLDWSKWLPDGDTITASVWTATPDSDIVIDSYNHTDTTATVWLSGGTVYQVYRVTNHITTNQGRVDERTFQITVSER